MEDDKEKIKFFMGLEEYFSIEGYEQFCMISSFMKTSVGVNNIFLFKKQGKPLPSTIRVNFPFNNTFNNNTSKEMIMDKKELKRFCLFLKIYSDNNKSINLLSYKGDVDKYEIINKINKYNSFKGAIKTKLKIEEFPLKNYILREIVKKNEDLDYDKAFFLLNKKIGLSKNIINNKINNTLINVNNKILSNINSTYNASFYPLSKSMNFSVHNLLIGNKNDKLSNINNNNLLNNPNNVNNYANQMNINSNNSMNQINYNTMKKVNNMNHMKNHSNNDKNVSFKISDNNNIGNNNDMNKININNNITNNINNKNMNDMNQAFNEKQINRINMNNNMNNNNTKQFYMNNMNNNLPQIFNNNNNLNQSNSNLNNSNPNNNYNNNNFLILNNFQKNNIANYNINFMNQNFKYNNYQNNNYNNYNINFMNQLQNNNKINDNSPNILTNNNNDININNMDIKNYEIQLLISEIFKEENIFFIVGLRNVGLTCYMNSTLQCLLHIPELNYFFLNIYPNKKDEFNEINKDAETYGKLSEQYFYLVKNVFEKNKEAISGNQGYFINDYSVSPKNFNSVLSNLNDQFSRFAANDSKDLLLYLFQSMHAELNYLGDQKLTTIPKCDQKNETDSYNFFLSVNNSLNLSIFSYLFYGILKSTTTCQECHTILYNFQYFQFLSFPIYNFNKKIFNIYQGFKEYIKPENMIGNNQCYCNTCTKLNDAEVTTKLFYTPPYLIINFDYGKDKKYMPKETYFAERIDLTDFTDEKCKNRTYQLIAVSTHIGKSGNTGHYIAYCKDIKNNIWHKFNDSYHDENCNFQNEVLSNTPYFLIYKKI